MNEKSGIMARGGILDVTKKHKSREISRLFIMGAWICLMLMTSCDSDVFSVTITAQEFRFTPDRVKIPANQRVRLIVRNQGRERHVFQSPIINAGDARFEKDSLPQQWTSAEGVPIQPGDRLEISLELNQGLYPFRCLIRGHKGMEGTLIVVK